MSDATPLIIDIETGPVPDDELRRMMPKLDTSKIKGLEVLGMAFDPGNVKLGNIKDEAKRLAKIEEANHKYYKELEAASAKLETAKAEQWDKYKERAPLSALTGRVLAVGLLGKGGKIKIIENDADEWEIIKETWTHILNTLDHGRRVVGHNLFGFDLPFLMRRSWLLGQQPMAGIRKGRYWHELMIDTMEVWGCGEYKHMVSLDILAKSMKVGQKPSVVTGKTFWQFWRGEGKQREKAREYLRNDLVLTAAVAERLGIS